MENAKLKAIEASGWKVGDAADFLEMSDDERQLLDARMKLAQAVCRQHDAEMLSEKQLKIILKLF